jgi:hypothetical protein
MGSMDQKFLSCDEKIRETRFLDLVQCPGIQIWYSMDRKFHIDDK